MNDGRKWGFYGRERELKRAASMLRGPLFATRVILGRRGVGKTKLLKVAAERLGTAPLVHCELPRTEVAGQQTLEEALEAAADDAGLGALHARLLGTLRRRSPEFRFVEMVDLLVKHGAFVALDEFHHGRELGLECRVKLMIDRLRHAGRTSPVNPERCGKLVLMGSHQQEMLRMFRSDQPLHLRVDSAVTLRQWRMPTVATMAAEHGLLARPKRFLTLWAAYGGMPGHWERFVTDAEWRELRDFGVWESGTAWRAAFLDAERAWLADNRRARFDNEAFMSLTPRGREVLLRLAWGRRRGLTISEFPEEWKAWEDPTLGDTLEVLSDHLELVAPTWQFLDEPKRWRVVDNSTQFQVGPLSVRPSQKRDNPDAVHDPGATVRRLQADEGTALERMAAAWLAAGPGVTWARHGVWVPKPEKGRPKPKTSIADIDVMAFHGSGAARTLVLGGCKRSAARQCPEDLERQFERFMAAAPKSAKMDGYRRLPRRKLAVSPEFDPDTRERCEAAGFECVDIARMAEPFGPEPPKATPERTRRPKRRAEPERGPSFGM